MTGRHALSVFAAAILALWGLVGLKPATAEAAGLAALATATGKHASAGQVEKVHYRKRHYRKRYYGKRWRKPRYHRRYYYRPHRHSYYDGGGYYDYGYRRRRVIVNAPFTHVYVGRGVHVRAPFVNLWVPRYRRW